MIFNDSARQRKAQSGTVPPGGIEGTEDVGQVLFRDAASSVRDRHAGAMAMRSDFDPDRARPIHCLHRVE